MLFWPVRCVGYRQPPLYSSSESWLIVFVSVILRPTVPCSSVPDEDYLEIEERWTHIGNNRSRSDWLETVIIWHLHWLLVFCYSSFVSALFLLWSFIWVFNKYYCFIRFGLFFGAYHFLFYFIFVNFYLKIRFMTSLETHCLLFFFTLTSIHSITLLKIQYKIQLCLYGKSLLIVPHWIIPTCELDAIVFNLPNKNVLKCKMHYKVYHTC